MLHGIYCDPSSPQNIRINALDICKNVGIAFTPETISELINRHNEYKINEIKKHHASQIFFKELGILNLLGEAELHSLISKSVRRLFNVHQDWNNFYNEPPFAEDLYGLVKQSKIPETALKEYVIVVVTCYVGNQYGVSNAAVKYYEDLIRSFSPKTISLMLKIPNSNTVVGRRIKQHNKCKNKFKKAVDLLDPKSISSSLKAEYNKYASTKLS